MAPAAAAKTAPQTEESDPFKYFVIAAWFALNISIGSLTKWLFLYGEICIPGSGCKKFDFPLTMTALHMLVSRIVCYIIIYHMREEPKGMQLSGMQRFYKVGPLAACFAASVGMGNASLSYIFPSFKQMVGSASPLVTVAMSVLLAHKRYNWWTWISMPFICGGLWICARKELHFSVMGTVLTVGAMVMRSLKSIVQAKLLSKEERIEPVTLLYYMSAYSAVVVFAMALLMEGTEPLELLFVGLQDLAQRSSSAEPIDATDLSKDKPRASGPLYVIILLLLSGFNACFLNISGFFTTRYTSAVTLQVLGSVKSCLGIVISVAILHNPLKPAQGVGVLVCLLGVWIYDRKSSVVQTPVLPKDR
eukprot:TRINITY_DN39447_c0_g1_i1.p1 TRINITY_DN39447_c0_g1~~TRINITY_DN39447_c0_g1_i1.p1  ORF type:complete len:362 (-),score=80.60 TRINITY_DN39447_c0_g1_i1:494-1579(-)